MSATFKPRIDASRATAAPLMPAPITARSNSSSRNRARLFSRLSVAAKLVFGIFLERVALLGPGVGVIVIAAHFPESAPVDVGKLDRAHPLRALPTVELRHDQAQRKSVIGLEIASVMPMDRKSVV